MIVIDVLEAKNLKFDVTIGGVEPDQLEGYLRFNVEGLEYGFPAIIKENNISVNIPPLTNVIKEKLKDGLVLKGRLEIAGDGLLVKPWEGEFKVKSKIQVEAKLISEENIVEEDDNFDELDNELKSITEIKVKNVTEDEKKERKPKTQVKETKSKPLSKREINLEQKLKGLVNAYLKETKEPIVESKPKIKTVPKKQTVKKESKSKNVEITKETLERRKPKSENKYQSAIDYMISKGLKNKRVQASLLEKAQVSGDTTPPAEVLEQVKKLI